MTKREYMDSLRELLSYELPERLVKKNIDFYEKYFEEQSESGKSAEMICAELGDPQLIARSCIDAEKSGADGIPHSEDDIDFSSEIYQGKSKDQCFGSSTSGEEKKPEPGIKRISCLVPVLILIVIIALLIAFFSTTLGSIVLTVILAAAVIGGIIRLIRRRQ